LQLKLRRKLSKSGLTLVLRIPRDIEKQLSLTENTEVLIWIKNGKVIIEPIQSEKLN